MQIKIIKNNEIEIFNGNLNSIKEKFDDAINDIKVTQIATLLYDKIRIKIESPLFTNTYHITNDDEYFIEQLEYIMNEHLNIKRWNK